MKLQKSFFSIASLLPLLVFYYLTLASGLTWTNAGVDGGDLITAAAINGVAHPSGYPLYLLLAKLFQNLPFENLAYCTNLMSALFAWMTALLVKFIVDEQTHLSTSKQVGWFPGIFSAYALGLAPLIWSQAVITEVYTLNAFFAALLIYITFRRENPHMIGVICGLALGNHLTIALLIPAVLITAAVIAHGINFRKLVISIIWMLAVSLVLYVILMFRAADYPPVNWENPSSLEGLFRLISGSIYQDYYLSSSNISINISLISNTILNQFGVAGFTLCMAGLFYSFTPSRRHWLLLWNFVIYILFSLFYRSPDANVYLIPCIISLAVWFGFALEKMLAFSGRWKYAVVILGFVYLGISSFVTRPKVDASHDSTAEMFGRRVMDQVPKEAVLFTRGDRALFTLWYFHFALNERSDLHVVSEELLGYAWYRETLNRTYPDLIIEDDSFWASAVIADNQNFPVCYVSYEADDKINCK